MRRTKQIQNLVDEVNCYLRRNKIKDESDPAFLVTMHSLLEQKIYHGFNYYKDGVVGDKVMPVLAGSATNFEYLQLY